MSHDLRNLKVHSRYQSGVAYVFLFNVIVGVGSLALPRAIFNTGLVLGLSVMAMMACCAYTSVTWLIECSAAANALVRSQPTPLRDAAASENSDDSDFLDLSAPNPSPFDIHLKFELSDLSEVFLNPILKKLLYITICVYLYGDLAIFAVSIALSLRSVTGPVSTLSPDATYRLYIAVFSVLIMPLALADFQKSKVLMYITMAYRFSAFWLMIFLAASYTTTLNRQVVLNHIPLVTPSGFKTLFGIVTYSFMCHHSVPGILTPMKSKKVAFKIFAGDYVTVYFTYFLMAVTAATAFGSSPHMNCIFKRDTFQTCQLQDLYSSNYASFNLKFVADFLALFPVITLGPNFALISITLRNNLMTLFGGSRKWLFALLAVVPPLILSACTSNLDTLIGVTGSYAGLGIMFFFPALLMYQCRSMDSKLERLVGTASFDENPYRSPFRSFTCIYIMFACALVCLFIVSLDHMFSLVEFVDSQY